MASDRTNLIEDVRTQNVGNQRGRHNANNVAIAAMNLLACMMLPITVLLCLSVMTD